MGLLPSKHRKFSGVLDPQELRVSVIIPAVNEEQLVGRAVDSAKGFDAVHSVLVVDGGSTDRTVERARAAGAQVLHAPRGRARQANAGSGAATGSLLLFLHADSSLPPRWGETLQKSFRKHDAEAGRPACWGCFETIQLDECGARMQLLRLGVAMRTACLHTPYGDQGIFVRHDVFRKHAGFRELDLMDDLDLVLRLRRHEGRPVIVPAAITTSARRWQALGLVRNTCINNGLVFAWLAGVPHSTLAKWYRGVAQRPMLPAAVSSRGLAQYQ